MKKITRFKGGGEKFSWKGGFWDWLSLWVGIGPGLFGLETLGSLGKREAHGFFGPLGTLIPFLQGNKTNPGKSDYVNLDPGRKSMKAGKNIGICRLFGSFYPHHRGLFLVYRPGVCFD